jgi:hypothetical protein
MPGAAVTVRAAALGAAALALPLAAAAPVAAPVAAAPAARVTGLHDARYCEIIALRGAPPRATATVWNTIGHNRCPAAWWTSLDAGTLAEELGASFVLLNGPRHFLMDAATARTGGVRTFHGMRLTEVATIPIRTAAELAQAPYTDRTVARVNTWRWQRGRTVFELVAPGGDVYVMQSYAQIRDPELSLAGLRRLGARLRLPEGWRYRARRLKRPLVLRARGRATILQDELQNTYQLAATPRRPVRRTRHRVRLAARLRTVPSASPGTLEDHGTVTGTPFGRGTVVLVGRLQGGRLDATFRLRLRHGSVLGTATLRFTVADGRISFRGTARLTAGTGAFRGIASAPLRVEGANTLDGQNGRQTMRGLATF